MLLGLAAALAAAAVFGVGAVVQAVAARRYGLLSALMVFVALAYVAGWALHLAAIALLPLHLAQAGIAFSLVFTAIVAAAAVKETMAPRHWFAVIAMVVGLGLLTSASGPMGEVRISALAAAMLYAGLLLTLLLGLAANRVESETGGYLLGAVSGLGACGSAVASRAVLPPGWDVALLATAPTIGLYGLLSFWLYSAALSRTSVASATAPMILLQTLGPAVVGIALFGDEIREGRWVAGSVGLALSLVGAVMLSGVQGRLEDTVAHRLETGGADHA